jgi:hypothetical protein
VAPSAITIRISFELHFRHAGGALLHAAVPLTTVTFGPHAFPAEFSADSEIWLPGFPIAETAVGSLLTCHVNTPLILSVFTARRLPPLAAAFSSAPAAARVSVSPLALRLALISKDLPGLYFSLPSIDVDLAPSAPQALLNLLTPPPFASLGAALALLPPAPPTALSRLTLAPLHVAVALHERGPTSEHLTSLSPKTPFAILALYKLFRAAVTSRLSIDFPALSLAANDDAHPLLLDGSVVTALLDATARSSYGPVTRQLSRQLGARSAVARGGVALSKRIWQELVDLLGLSPPLHSPPPANDLLATRFV